MSELQPVIIQSDGDYVRCSLGELYLKDEVDEAIAELNAENKRIKLSAEKVLRDLLECGLIKEWYFNGKFNAVLKADDPHLKIAELKQKLEDTKASHYAEMVDAGMRERRLRRVLCLLRFAFSKLEQNYIGRFEYNESKWDEMWEKRADYWKAKAEEYK